MQSVEVIYTSTLSEEILKHSLGRKVAVVCSKEIAALPAVSALLNDSLNHAEIIYVTDGEHQKEFDTFTMVLERLGSIRFPRDGLIIGLGGGATTDLAGFVAATWMRGVDWLAIPTSLAGMVDAAIGGKTGINISTGKNLVGAFHLPLATLVDQEFLSTLPRRDLAAGMSEVLKCGFISDETILDIAEKVAESDLVAPDESKILGELIRRSVAVKQGVVAEDVRESGVRAILNYGHTLGHAIEIAENFGLRHGEAVAIGMVFAAELSASLHGLNQSIVDRHRELLRKFDLPTTYAGASFDVLLEIMERDKKVKDGKLRFITLRAVGQPEISQVAQLDTAREIFNDRIFTA